MLHRKFLLGTTVIAGLMGTLAIPSVTFAQAAPPPPAAAPAPADDASDVEALVVTGSRIKRTEFTSASPVQVITTESATLEGLVDAAQILQSSTVASGSTQINNQFTGYVINGGGGVNTISLRGLGDNRTLVLMNGRRLPSSGTQGAVAAVDLNILPSAVVERYEILKDGASSVYGSDAVAGVVNVITRTKLDGWRFEADGTTTFDGGADQVDFSAAYGKVFDRGHFQVSLDYYDQKPLKAGDRDEFLCGQSYLRNPTTGARQDWYDTDTGNFKCTGPSGAAWGYIPVYNANFSFRGSRAKITTEGPTYAADPGGRWPGSPTEDALLPGYRFAPLQERNFTNPQEANIDIFSPVTRTTIYADGAYDVGFGELYTEFLWNNRKSSQNNIQQMFPNIAPTAPCPVNPLNCADIPLANHNLFSPQALLITPYSFEQDVDVWRVLGGLRGDFGGSFLEGWSYDVYASYSNNKGKYTQVGINAEKFLAEIGGDYFQTGTFLGICPVGSPAGCQPLNLFSDTILTTSGLAPADYQYLRLSSTGETDYTQTIVEGQISGDLFALPAGNVSGAFGLSYRHDKLDDKPGADMVSGNFYNLGTALRTTGSETVKEAYAELEVPLIRNVPGAEAITVNGSARYSDYKTYGSNSTYKLSLNWTINSAWRLRATKGTSFRAPAIFELNQGAAGGFLSQGSVDPCINYDQPEKNASATLKANCLADGVPGNYTGAGSSAFIQVGGGSDLKAEESDAKTVGVIWTPSFMDLSVALDYYEIEVQNEVTSNGAAVVGQCYTAADFPTNPFCSLFTRDPGTLNITFIDASYRNIVSQTSRGLDLTTRYTHDLGPGKITLDTQFTWTLEDTQDLFPGKTDDFNGIIGEPSVTGVNQIKYQQDAWTVAFTSRFVGAQGNYNYQFGNDLANSNFATPTGALSRFDNHAEAVLWHDVSVQYQADTWAATFGLTNIFGEKAPNVSSPITPDAGNFTYGRLGTQAFATQYYELYRGRGAFVNFSKTF